MSICFCLLNLPFFHEQLSSVHARKKKDTYWIEWSIRILIVLPSDIFSDFSCYVHDCLGISKNINTYYFDHEQRCDSRSYFFVDVNGDGVQRFIEFLSYIYILSQIGDKTVWCFVGKSSHGPGSWLVAAILWGWESRPFFFDDNFKLNSPNCSSSLLKSFQAHDQLSTS